MQTLFAFIRKHNFFFLFIILEGFAFWLITTYNPYQKTRFLHSTNSLTAKINATYNSVFQYFHLKETNLILNEENARLRTGFIIRSYIKDSLEYSIRDTSYIFIPAKVINNSIHRRNNFIMLNKGSVDGVEPDMGVVSSRGVIGVVIEVSNNYCTVLSLLHKDARVSAKIKKNNQLANVTWPGFNYREAWLEDIPSHIKLLPGDTIISSGYSFLYPEGLIIGTVKEHGLQSMGNFNRALIELSADFNSLQYVYIVKNLQSKEQRRLSIESKDE